MGRTRSVGFSMTALEAGLYDKLITLALEHDLRNPKIDAKRMPLSADTAPDMLAKHLSQLAYSILSSFTGKDSEKMARQIELANAVIRVLVGREGAVDADDLVTQERLLQVLYKHELRLGTDHILRPSLPLRHSELLVNGPQDPRVGLEIGRELASADRVDVLVSFIKWSGFVELRDALQSFCDRHAPNPPLRVLTTTYMSATDHEALDALAAMGADVRVSYDSRRTRLHAKAWIFHRKTGFSTGIVGSSNLSYAALRDGCEWNVRLSNIDNPAILRKFEATFEQYWEDGTFEIYDRQRFIKVLNARRNPERDALAVAIALHPYPHQTIVLEALAAERAAKHNRNLVIAATGTGKTVIAALDYKRIGERPSLLFVAHRREILEKSRATYRVALGDGSFGELLTGTDKPLVGRHVFASIQSLRGRRLSELQSGDYDVIVVDEFHHAEADTYTALLNHLTPKILLGLTATPERTDGQSIMHWFEDRIAAESRLWDALDQALLVPFQYFGIDDQTDLSQVDFRAGRYAIDVLEMVYTADEHRAKQVLRALAERVRDPTRMRALGFCVSVKHANFMAAFFRNNGLRALAVTGNTPKHERRSAVQELAQGKVCALFSVDVFNEGVDIPAVDTVLFLRPTESATIYLQQLGRGLRLSGGKPCLTVLDFIGRANRKFRFDRRFRALVGGGTRAEVRSAIEEGFPRLPSGCSIQLEEEAQKSVLANIKQTLSKWIALAEDLEGDWPLETFINRADVDLHELYLPRKCFSLLRKHRGYLKDVPDNPIVRAIPRILHIDDLDRLTYWRSWLEEDSPPTPNPNDPYQLMLFAALGQAQRPVSELGEFFNEVFSHSGTLSELRQLLKFLDDRRRRPTYPLPGLPFHIHGTYSRDEVSAGLTELRKGKLLRTQGGVYQCKKHRCDVLFVTLEKDEKDFTPTTLYNDYPLSQRRFHWESQSTTRLESTTGLRYRQPPMWWRILLFVRKAKKDERKITMPYLFLGPVRCVSADSERPIQIIWELERPMPAGWFNEVKIAAG
jgi:superfamily II DNA or RNA helicase/HKD family nuclease